MHSNISSAASSLPEKVRACTHSALMAPIGDSVTALPHGLETDPMDGTIPLSPMVLPISSDTYWLPWSE